MKRQRALEFLPRSKPELQARFGADFWRYSAPHSGAWLKADSDIDILVAFDGPAISRRISACSFV